MSDRTKSLRDFVKHKPTDRIGLVYLNDRQPGVMRGQYEVWYGARDGDGVPILVTCQHDDLDPVEVPRAFERGA